MNNRQRHPHLLRARRLTVAVLALLCLSMFVPALASMSESGIGVMAPRKPRSKAATDPAALPSFSPQIPRARRNTNQRVFLEKADLMYKGEMDTFVMVTGNVEFSHGNMLMFCDSAQFFPGSESLNAFGNVRMRQGDTLFVYADELNYSGTTHMAYLYGNDREQVRVINRDVTLTTPIFVYDLVSEYGYYYEGGELTDKKNRLTSRIGEYIPRSKEANFYDNVVLRSRSNKDTLMIYTDTLFYNTRTHIAEVSASGSRIISADAVITTDYAVYNTELSQANLFNRSLVTASTGATLVGDTLYYDRKKGFGEAFGNVEIVDTAHKVILTGNYGYYNELIDSAFTTGNALAREYSQGDTLYLHGTYLYGYAMLDTVKWDADTLLDLPAGSRIDTSYVMVAHPRVRFYRKDVQGICDSMRFEQRDTMLYMYHHPIVWSDERQIYGNVIQVHFNDSTVEQATLPDFGFSAERVEGEFFNQISGKEMIAYFTGGELTRVDVNGNVQAIMLPEENDSTYNKIVNVESSNLRADFDQRKIVRAKMWPETQGTVTPLYLAKKSIYYLPSFKWYTDMRPIGPYDVLTIPTSMETLMMDIPPSVVVPGRHGAPQRYRNR